MTKKTIIILIEGNTKSNFNIDLYRGKYDIIYATTYHLDIPYSKKEGFEIKTINCNFGTHRVTTKINDISNRLYNENGISPFIDLSNRENIIKRCIPEVYKEYNPDLNENEIQQKWSLCVDNIDHENPFPDDIKNLMEVK